MSLTNNASDGTEKIPIDSRLLSDAIIELNISRRNVSIFPKDHPSVEKSLSRAFEFLQKLFEFRAEITLAVAKDTLIIDDFFLDKKNPVYREFALQLSKMNITYVTFLTGLRKEELYEFHHIISGKIGETSPQEVQEMFREKNMIHLKAGFIDYDAFSFEEGKTDKESLKAPLWERYVYGLLEGTLQTGDISEGMLEIPPDMLARLVNRTAAANIKEETYDRVITSYMRRSSGSAFSNKDLKRLMDFINGLRPELKKQFLSSTVKEVSKDMDAAYRALSKISIDEILELLRAINEQKVAIPGGLKNLLDKLSGLPQYGTDGVSCGGDGFLVDDIFLAPDIVNLFGDANFDSYVTGTYQKEIQKLLDFDASKIAVAKLKETAEEFSDDFIEKDFNQTLLELLSSEILSDEEYRSFVDIVRSQIEQFMWTGLYRQILKAIQVFELNATRNKFPEMTSETLQYFNSLELIAELIDSMRIMGRHRREDAWLLCEYYGDKIISLLIDALIEEDSQNIRRFFLGLLEQFGDRAIAEVTRRLGDSRWFVKRNMLYILGNYKKSEVLPHVRPYCRHENSKVGFEAIKCLLNFGDGYGIDAIKDYLQSKSREEVGQAITLSGAFRIKEVVPDLIQMLRKREISGADFYDKIPIVRALGCIGDPRALSALKDLLSGKSILFKGIAEKLREEIYGTLKNYPYEHVSDLIEAGLQSKNESIREESLRLHKAKAD